MSKFKNRKMIFWFRFFAVIDVLFSYHFELQTRHKKGLRRKSETYFNKGEILNAKL